MEENEGVAVVVKVVVLAVVMVIVLVGFEGKSHPSPKLDMANSNVCLQPMIHLHSSAFLESPSTALLATTQ